MIEDCETDREPAPGTGREPPYGHAHATGSAAEPYSTLLRRIADLEAENRRLRRAVRDLAHRVLTGG